MLTAKPTQIYRGKSDVPLPDGSILIHGHAEERSQIPDHWQDTSVVSRFEICESNQIEFFDVTGATSMRVEGARKSDMDTLLASFRGREVYVDFTGLSHHVWMPILRFGLEAGLDMYYIYSEPDKYQATNSPRPGEFFDLSERIRGIAPIPSFTRLTRLGRKERLTVPLLGFEGPRFHHVIEYLQPEGRSIRPIVGVPGFAIDYPFHTYIGNASTLSTTRAWENVAFIDAACPFSVTDHLTQIQQSDKNLFLQVPLIGTKPHALGAALYALQSRDVELVYDHPVRKPGRTTGASRCHVYRVSTFMSGRQLV